MENKRAIVIKVLIKNKATFFIKEIFEFFKYFDISIFNKDSFC